MERSEWQWGASVDCLAPLLRPADTPVTGLGGRLEKDTMEPGKRYVVFSVLKSAKNSAAVWIRAGVANVNRDGSMNVTLDALPVDGKLHIREVGSRGEVGQAAVK